MAIEVKRVGTLYEAKVTPPHGGGRDWSTPSPMTAEQLVGALRELGCHQADIGDALYEADPEWLLRGEAAR
jgi:hypothetical protein